VRLETALAKYGLLLLQDKTLPSVVSIITGEKVAGSWWSHPRAHEIFRSLEQLDDAIAVKLIGGKVTFVDSRLQPAIAAIGRARDPWQMRGLSAAAKKLLARVDREGSVRASGAASKELQLRLLVNAREEHTESGKHETALAPWPAVTMNVVEAKQQIEDAAEAIGARELLPWFT